MQKLVRDYLDELKRQRKKHRRARIAVMLLIVLVAGTVTSGLTRNGITMTEDARCGLIEHEHTDECYQEVLICGYGGLLQEDDDVSDSLQETPGRVSAPEEEAEESLRPASAKQAGGHHHSDDCYELRDVLLCGEKESEGHHHTDGCYEIKTSLACGKEESEGHTHTDACYETKDILVCDSEDDEEHEHTDDCYESEITNTLICSEKESEGHTHTDDCYETESVLICDEEEYTGHEHTDHCYGQEKVLICGQEEGEEPAYSESPEKDLPSDAQDEKTEQAGDITQEAEHHVHTEDCYELQPVCGIPEHTHSEECRIDTSADVEDESDWDAQYADVEWADAWGADLVTAAQMQIGYRESMHNYRIAEDGSHKGYTRYGAFAGDAYVDWDAVFVNFCMYYAGLADTELFPQELDAGDWYDAFVEADEKNAEYLTAPDGYEPEAGDLIFFERDKEEEEEPERMMGIVSSYDEEQNTVMVIEGNSNNEVRENTYDIDDEQIGEYLMITALEGSVKTDEPVTEDTGLIFTTEDMEDASDWDAQYADVEWTDAWGADLVTAAQMQIGYRESEDDYEVAEDGSLKGYTRYGAFAGDEYADWDAVFVNFCMYYAGLADTDLFPQELDAGDWYDAFVEADEQNMEYLTAPDGYEPEAGDLVFFERETEEGASGKEMGIVSSYDAEQNEVTVIEGDSDDEVRENTYDADDEQIGSYLTITALEESVKIRTLTAEGEDYTIEVRFTEEAGIPEDAILDVREITADSDEYWEYYEQSLESLEAEAFSYIRCFDITFLVDGEKIEPLAPVDVQIIYADTVELDEEGEDNVVHFAADGAEVLEVETDEEGRSLHFSQDSFSVFVAARVTSPQWNIGTDKIKEFGVKSLEDLVGKQFLITNANNAMKDKNDEDGNPDNLENALPGPEISSSSLDDFYFWTFERVAGDESVAGDSGQFYIKNVGSNRYLYMEGPRLNSGSSRCKMGVKEEKTQLTVCRDNGGKIGIYTESESDDPKIQYPYYINNFGGGNDRKFVGYSENFGLASQLTLYTLKDNWDIVLNPGNVGNNYQNSIYHIGIDVGKEPSTKRIVETIDHTAGPVVEIKLPNNDDIRGEDFTLRNGSLPHTIENNEYRLKGWYNIGTGEYYSVEKENPPVEGREEKDLFATVKQKDNNVFYADWVAASYNVANDVPEDQLLPTVDTDGFLTTELFDYNELANISIGEKVPEFGVDLEQHGVSSEDWTQRKKFGNDQGFVFGWSPSGQLSSPNERYTGNQIKFDKMLADKNSVFFNTLFSSDSDAIGVEYVGRASGLFKQYREDDENYPGYYEYNSDTNAADYNKAQGKFYVYDSPQGIKRPWEVTTNSFLPFNAYGKTYPESEVNYWFGMKTEINFWLNQNSDKTGEKNQNYGKQMEFVFEGDDDLWVFVDEELVLDLSGIHDKWGGTINFSTGKVTVRGVERTEPYEFEAGPHKLTIYYMERGTGASNCHILFNLIPVWHYEGTPVQTVSVVKNWQDADGTPYTPNQTEEKGYPDIKLYEKDGATPVAEDRKNWEFDPVKGWVCTWRYLDPEKEYEVRETSSGTYVQVEGPVKSDLHGENSYWLETSELSDGDEIVIGNGTGKVLAVDSLGDLIGKDIAVSEIGDVLIDDGTNEISIDEVWIVCMAGEKNGHVMFRLQSKSSGKFLKIMNVGNPEPIDVSSDESTDESTNESTNGSIFFFAENGNLTGTIQNKLVVDGTAELGFAVAGQTDTEADNASGGSSRRVHIYRYDALPGSLTTYTITNKEIAARIQLKKVSRTDDTKALTGASFKLYGESDYDENNKTVSDGAEPVATFVESPEGSGNFLSQTETEIKTETGTETKTETDKLLLAGTYYLVETRAPEGYALLESPIKIVIGKTDPGENAEGTENMGATVTAEFKVDEDWDNRSHVNSDENNPNTFIITVPNIVLYTLPSTGGIGIYWYMFGGVLLMVTALLVTYKTKFKTEQGS